MGLAETSAAPGEVQAICLTAQTIAAKVGKADIAKPLKGKGSGVMETVLPYRGNAFRVVYAFHKMSTHGIRTPEHEIDLIAAQVKLLKDMLR